MGRLISTAGIVIAITMFTSPVTWAADDLEADPLLTEARSLVTLIKRIDQRSKAAISTYYKVYPSPDQFRVPYLTSIKFASLRYGIPKSLIAAVIKCESNWDPRARSTANAMGLMQVLPQTAWGTFGIRSGYLWDPATNITVGTAYLRLLADRYHGDTLTVIAAYNAGPTRIDRRQTLPRETRSYTRCIRRWYATYNRTFK